MSTNKYNEAMRRALTDPPKPERKGQWIAPLFVVAIILSTFLI